MRLTSRLALLALTLAGAALVASACTIEIVPHDHDDDDVLDGGSFFPDAPASTDALIDAVTVDGGFSPDAATVCGDGFVDTFNHEVCDDGNNISGDGCSADCHSDETCGNGVLDQISVFNSEVCDDGNNVNGDGCSADCRSGEGCGNGIVDTVNGETCDDGNLDNGDGCNNSCQTETVQCGNGVVDAGEQCDSGQPGINTATCDHDCTLAQCGDNTVNFPAGEQCDTGGMTAACDSDCTAAVCGDGLVNTLAGEECDDGNFNNGDACPNDCQLP